MNRLHKRIVWALAGMLLSFGSVPATYADDTELFRVIVDPNVETARPNILFIIDTSGSMRSTVETKSVYDPAKIYDGCYGLDRVYFNENSDRPACDHDEWVNLSAFVCAAAEADHQTGSYRDYFAQWSTKKSEWRDPKNGQETLTMECAADSGVHGEIDGDPRTYAVDDLKYNATSTGEIDWQGDFGQVYTWTSNYLNWWSTESSRTQTRLEVVQEVTTELVNDIDGVNLGLMRFNRNVEDDDGGGPVIHAMENIATARQVMIDKINALPASGNTPLSETMYEANQYYNGWAVDWGNHPTVPSVPESRTTPTSNVYKKPQSFACNKNYVVMLTDGAPTRDTKSEDDIEALPEFSTLVSNQCDVENPNNANGKCLDDLAAYMYKHDLDPDTEGLQNVSSYTVGFTIDLPILAQTAERGGGQYFLADDANNLKTALTDIVQLIKEDSTTFSSPAVPVNAFNRIQNLNDLYVSVFSPTLKRHWRGNVKKYRFVNGEIVDQNGKAAVNQARGFFDAESQSFWSDEVDGTKAWLGGAAHKIPAPDNRELYTSLGTGSIRTAGNAVKKSNDALTPAKLGVPVSLDYVSRDLTIDHMRGVDVKLENGSESLQRFAMGDPLHVAPVPVIYGGTEDDIDTVVYISTNDGFFHAIDPDTGIEKWAFVPERLLDQMYRLYLDPVVTGKDYGLDGEIEAVILNNDFSPGISGDERVILVFGMRRGGDAVFALEVTDPDNPSLLWEIDSNNGNFDTLGQTWSKPQHARVYAGGAARDVVIFGGGYDAGQDSTGYSTDSKGNDVYMVDVETGDLIWRASENLDDMNFDMEHSIPANVKIMDLTGDGFANRMYVGDMGGRLWRFDIHNGESGDDLVSGGVIASLGAADLAEPTAADLRRFYVTPDLVAIGGNAHHDPYFAINIGSGYRAHPLDTSIDEWFFSVRDYKPFSIIETDDYPDEPIVIGDLQDITADASPVMQPGSDGWRLQLNAAGGEKVLGEAVTFRGTVFFVSFAPEKGSGICETGYGRNFLYRVSLKDGAPDPHPDDLPEPPDEPEPEDRYTQLDQQGIAPAPSIFFTEKDGDGDDGDDDPDVCEGVECDETGSSNNFTRSYWFQNEVQ